MIEQTLSAHSSPGPYRKKSIEHALFHRAGTEQTLSRTVPKQTPQIGYWEGVGGRQQAQEGKGVRTLFSQPCVDRNPKDFLCRHNHRKRITVEKLAKPSPACAP